MWITRINNLIAPTIMHNIWKVSQEIFISNPIWKEVINGPLNRQFQPVACKTLIQIYMLTWIRFNLRIIVWMYKVIITVKVKGHITVIYRRI